MRAPRCVPLKQLPLDKTHRFPPTSPFIYVVYDCGTKPPKLFIETVNIYFAPDYALIFVV